MNPTRYLGAVRAIALLAPLGTGCIGSARADSLNAADSGCPATQPVSNSACRLTTGVHCNYVAGGDQTDCQCLVPPNAAGRRIWNCNLLRPPGVVPVGPLDPPDLPLA